VLLHDARKLLPPGRHSDLQLQIGRSRRARALAADLAELEGAPDFGSYALAPVLDAWMMEQLGVIVRKSKGITIGALANLPKLEDLQQGVVYYIAGSMRYSMVRWKRLSETDARCLFLSSAEAEAYAASLPISICRKREKWGGLAYPKPAFWEAIYTLDRIFTKFCTADALAGFGKNLIGQVQAAIEQHLEVMPLFETAAALCSPAVTGAVLLHACCTTYSFTRQKELVSTAVRQLGIVAEEEMALRKALRAGSKSKQKAKAVERAESDAEKVRKATARRCAKYAAAAQKSASVAVRRAIKLQVAAKRAVAKAIARNARAQSQGGSGGSSGVVSRARKKQRLIEADPAGAQYRPRDRTQSAARNRYA
jgi:hypothetical protein